MSQKHNTLLPLVSICVPIYNVEAYIESCVRSLMEQDYANIEYIFVNDGSTDDSMQRLEAVLATYLERQSMVHIYHNDRNHGLAYTRRVSIEKATGEYVACVDSDDWVDKNYVSVMVNRVYSSKADIVSGSYCEHVGAQTNITCRPMATDFGEVIQDRCFNRADGKLIKRSLFFDSQCFPPEGMDILEDRYMLTVIRYHNPKEAICSEPLYHYRFHRVGALTETKTDYTFQCQLLFYQYLEHFMEDKPDKNRWKSIINQQKIADKAALMLRCGDELLRKKYAPAFREVELRYLWTLRGSFFIVLFFIHFRLWKLLSLYQLYINWREK
ncbi:MAG: glycosyltransferase [Bacteroidaceae bacterium]|nr:glycosyltransferase [Bacteroidaceae bacterium]